MCILMLISKYIFQGFPMDDIARSLTKVDCQPTLDGGVLVFVLGQLKVAVNVKYPHLVCIYLYVTFQ